MGNNSEYAKLKALWYKKLKDEGFDDIEQDEDNLKSWSAKFVREGSPLELIESKTAYYQMATNFLNDYDFETELEKIIWTYHSEAISYRNIAKLLKESKVIETNRTTIWQIVKRLGESMKKMYLSGYAKHNE